MANPVGNRATRLLSSISTVTVRAVRDAGSGPHLASALQKSRIRSNIHASCVFIWRRAHLERGLDPLFKNGP